LYELAIPLDEPLSILEAGLLQLAHELDVQCEHRALRHLCGVDRLPLLRLGRRLLCLAAGMWINLGH
jgi:hypothetical protein